MNTLNPILAIFLRIAGALAGVGMIVFVPDAKLAETIAATGLAGVLDPAMARLVAHAMGGVVGFVIAAQIVGLLGRPGRTPHGTRSEAAESVPRLRRHLVDGDAPKRGSAMPDYLDPDPAPTKPVAVSFAELGLDHPSASEYPMPAGHHPESGDDFAFAEPPYRPDHAGSASDEWDAPAPNLKASVPSAPPQPREPQPREPQISPARAEAAAQARQLAEAEAQRAEPSPAHPVQIITIPDEADEPMLLDAEFDREVADAAVAEEVAPASIDATGCGAATPLPAVSEPPLGRADFAPPHAAAPAPLIDPLVPHAIAEPAQPRFSISAESDSDWYDGAGDEEEDAEDDGAGYGSLISIGLGKSHAPRGQVGQRGEAGLAPTGGPLALVPHGKPQDFRLREALAELQRLDQADVNA